MWGISPSFWSRLFPVHNLYIYLTCFCVRWPPAFFRGRGIEGFSVMLSCFVPITQAACHPTYGNAGEHGGQTHAAIAPTATHECTDTQGQCHTNSQHTNTQVHTEWTADPLRLRDKLTCAVAWVFCIPVCEKGCGIFLSQPCMRKRSASNAPRGGHMADKNGGGGRARAEQTHRSWLKFCYLTIVSLCTTMTHTIGKK